MLHQSVVGARDLNLRLPRRLVNIDVMRSKTMGKVFKYISDAMTETKGFSGPCHSCENVSKLYPMYSTDDGTDDPPLEMCIPCIKSIPIEWLSKHDEDSVRKMGSERFPGIANREERIHFLDATREEFRRTPDLPNMVNWGRWPVCCADFTEYIGDAGISYLGPYEEFAWYGPADHCDASLKLPDIVLLPNLKQLDAFSLFACLTCPQKYWTHNV